MLCFKELKFYFLIKIPVELLDKHFKELQFLKKGWCFCDKFCRHARYYHFFTSMQPFHTKLMLNLSKPISNHV